MLVKTDPDQIQSYLADSSNMSGGYASGVAIPKDYKEVSSFLMDCSSKKIPVTVSGGGTGTVGGRIPFGGFVLSTEGLNRIIDIQDDYAVLQGGVFLLDLQAQVLNAGRFYPPDSTEQLATMGGNIATNASGARSYHYGPTRDFVKSIKVALSSGKIIEIERGKYKTDESGFVKFNDLGIKVPSYDIPNVKNTAGYYVKKNMDPIDLFIGQDGTLGVVLEAKVKLLKKPNFVFDCVSFFNNKDDALKFISDIRSVKSVLSIEYMDKNSLNLLRSDYPSIPKDAIAVIFEEQSDDSPDYDKWNRILEKNNTLTDKIWLGDSPASIDRIKKFRHRLPSALFEFFSSNNISKISTDIAVPPDRLINMLDLYENVLIQNNLNYVIFGHIGQNHLHVNILPRNRNEFELSQKVYMSFVKAGISFGGTVSAEHGIGKLKKIYLEEMFGRKTILKMVSLKKEIDPSCILGRGNVFDERLLD